MAKRTLKKSAKVPLPTAAVAKRVAPKTPAKTLPRRPTPGVAKEVYLPPGTKVQYDGCEDGPEYGIVVHCWMNEEIHGYDCYVAFFGDELPAGVPSERPYLLRYFSASLKVIA